MPSKVDKIKFEAGSKYLTTCKYCSEVEILNIFESENNYYASVKFYFKGIKRVLARKINDDCLDIDQGIKSFSKWKV